MDARDIDTQIADSICHGERIATIELLSRRIQCDPEVGINIPTIGVKILFGSQKFLIEAIVGISDCCGVGLAFPCNLVGEFGCTTF